MPVNRPCTAAMQHAGLCVARERADESPGEPGEPGEPMRAPANMAAAILSLGRPRGPFRVGARSPSGI